MYRDPSAASVAFVVVAAAVGAGNDEGDLIASEHDATGK